MSGSDPSDDLPDAARKYAPQWARGSTNERRSAVVVQLSRGSKPVRPGPPYDSLPQHSDNPPQQHPGESPPLWRNSASPFEGDGATEEKPLARRSLAPEIVRQPPESDEYPHLGIVVSVTAAVALAAVTALVVVVVIPNLLPTAAQQSKETSEDARERLMKAYLARNQQVVVNSSPRVSDERARPAMEDAARIGTTAADAHITPTPVSSRPPLPPAVPVQQITDAFARSAPDLPSSHFVQQSVDPPADAVVNGRSPELRRQFEQLLAEHPKLRRVRSQSPPEIQTPSEAHENRQTNKRPYRPKKHLTLDSDNGG